MHEAAAQRQRAARAESHDIAEETSGDEAMMEERDDDKERGDGAGRDENKRRRHQRTLEEALGIGDDPTRGRREGGEVTQTATRGAVPYGLGLPQAAPPRGREERRRLAEVEKSRERCLELLTAKRPAKRDGRSRDGDAGQPTGGERAARKKRPEVWLKEALDADRWRFEKKAAEEERETLRREREMLRRTSEKGGEGRHEYDRDRSDSVSPTGRDRHQDRGFQDEPRRQKRGSVTGRRGRDDRLGEPTRRDKAGPRDGHRRSQHDRTGGGPRLPRFGGSEDRGDGRGRRGRSPPQDRNGRTGRRGDGDRSRHDRTGGYSARLGSGGGSRRRDEPSSSRSRSRERRDGPRRRDADRSGGRRGGRRTPDGDEWDDDVENAPIPKHFARGMVAVITSRPGLPNNMIIMDCPLHIDFIQRLLANNRDCWTHGKSLIVTIAPGIQVPINCYLRSSQKKLAKLSPGRALAALEGFIREVNLRKSREYDDDPELVEPVIVEDVQDLIPLMSLRILKDERHALEEQGYVVRRVLANASIPPAGPPAGETGTREASGPTVEPPETNEGGHEDKMMERVTKALKAARDAYGSTGELSRKTRSALVEMRHEAYKSAAEIVDATWRLLMKDGWRVVMRNPQGKKSEARYVNPQWTSYPNDERGFFPSNGRERPSTTERSDESRDSCGRRRWRATNFGWQ